MKVLIKNFFTLAAGEFIAKGVGFVTTIYLARILGVEAYGILGFVLAVYAYFFLIANPGFDLFGARETAKDIHSAPEVVRMITASRLVLSLGAFILLVGFSFLCVPDRLTREILILQGLSLLLVFLYFQFFFHGIQKMSFVAGSRIVQSLLFLLLVFLLVKSGDDLPYVPIAFLISTAIAFLPLVFLYKRQHGKILRFPNYEEHKNLLFASFTIGLSAIMVQIYYNMDIVILGFFRSSVEVGLYTAAYKILMFVISLPSIVFASYFPSLSKALKEKKGEQLLRSYILTLSILGIPIGFIGLLIGEPLMVLLFGSIYYESVTPLYILLFNASFVFLNVAIAHPLIAADRQKEYLIIVSLGALVNFAANMILIPLYGMTGAAVATVLAEAVVFFAARRAMRISFSLKPDGIVLSVLFPAALAYIICIAFTSAIISHPLITVTLYITMYAGLLYFMKRLFPRHLTISHEESPVK